RALDLPGSARRVLRDILATEPRLGPPTCDIGFPELVALSRTGGDPLEGLITTTQGASIVELRPFVWTAVNTSSKPLVETQRLPERERAIVATMGKQIDRLREIYEDLLGDSDMADTGAQASLFPQRRKKK